MKFRLLIIYACAILIAACSSNRLPKKVYNEKIAAISKGGSVMIVLNGKKLASGELVSDDKLRAALENILRKNEDKWEETGPVSYVSKLQFVAEGLTINIIDDGIILNIQIKENKWKQYSVDIAPDNLNSYINEILQPR